MVKTIVKTGWKLAWLVIPAGLLSFAPNGHATQPPVVSMTLTTPTGNNTSYPNDVFAGVYVNPYIATVNGVAGVPVICDDFVDDTALNSTWNAEVLNSTDLNLSRMTQLVSPTATQYGEVAWLSAELETFRDTSSTDPNAATNAIQRANISFALWSIFEPTAVNAWLTNTSHLSTAAYNAAWGPATTQGTISWWIAQAGSQTTATLTAALGNITIYSPCSSTNVTTCPSASVAQEFIVVNTPDAPALEALGLSLLALGTLVFLARKRTVSRV